MQDIRFEKVSDDTTILAIGSLFRRVNNTQWGINLDLAPQAEIGSLRVSNLPVLARKRVLNPTQKHKSAGFRLSFTIESSATWQRRCLGDFPVSLAIRAMDKRQHCFCFWQTTYRSIFPN
jgi:hypothetical protein